MSLAQGYLQTNLETEALLIKTNTYKEASRANRKEIIGNSNNCTQAWKEWRIRSTQLKV